MTRESPLESPPEPELPHESELPHEPEPPAERADMAADPPAEPQVRRRSAGRPIVERLGLALIALVLAALFGVVAVAGFVGGEPFLGVMGGVGCLMTLWVGGLTVIRG